MQCDGDMAWPGRDESQFWKQFLVQRSISAILWGEQEEKEKKVD